MADFTITSTSTLPPGAPSKNHGPTWAPGMFDTLMLPNGSVVGQVDDPTLRNQLARVGIAGAHTDGRAVIVERYAATLKAVHDDAGSRAVTEWLAQRK